MDNTKALMLERASAIEKQIMTLKVTNVGELKSAGDLLFNIKDFIRVWDSKKKELIKPFKDGIRGIEAEFDPKIEEAKKWKGVLEGTMANFQMEELRRRQTEERQRKAAELLRLEKEKEVLEAQAVESNNEKLLDKAIQVEQHQEKLLSQDIRNSFTVKSESASTGLKMIKDYEILSEDEVPREYCSPDRGKLRAAVNRGVKDIKGVRVFEKPSVVSRL